ncbi:hypothetical protein PVAP13_8KG286701 [Panicum virgatum]|uniref:Uncharacterized protein n=1 Tax=Panicum virgatum TaxID=38727 RepID=A0A8T0PKH0_PANVG|nr:hypothetical protein PVAP13_8KG286701 [Panicum virgatum]
MLPPPPAPIQPSSSRSSKGPRSEQGTNVARRWAARTDVPSPPASPLPRGSIVHADGRPVRPSRGVYDGVRRLRAFATPGGRPFPSGRSSITSPAVILSGRSPTVKFAVVRCQLPPAWLATRPGAATASISCLQPAPSSAEAAAARRRLGNVPLRPTQNAGPREPSMARPAGPACRSPSPTCTMG